MYSPGLDAEGYEAKGRIEKFSAIFALFVIGMTVFLLGLGAYGLFDVDETRYAASVMEMLRSGNYIIPTFNGLPRLNKPILFYWLLAASVKTFGPTPFAFRAVSGLFAFSLCLWVGHVVYRESRVEGGFLAGCILATSPLFAYLGRVVMTDMVFSVCIFVSALLLYLGIFDSRKVEKKYIILSYVFMGLGFLTKGPAGVVLPLGSAFIFGFINGRLRETARALLSPAGILIFTAIAAPWYVAVAYVKGPDFFVNFFLRENVLRFLRVTSGHRGPVFYYVPIVIIGMFPWSFFLPQAVFRILRERGFSLKTFEENVSLDMFLLVYALFIFLFFSLSATKLPTYILSIFPALSVIVALYLERVILEVRYPSFGFYVGAYVFAFFALILGLVLLFPAEYFPEIKKLHLGTVLVMPTILFLFSATLTALFTIFRRSLKRVRVKIFSVMLLTQLFFLWTVFFGVLPTVYARRQGDLREIGEILKGRAKEGDTIIFYRKFKPSVVLHSGKKVLKAETFEEVVALWKRGDLYLIFRGKEPAGLPVDKLGTVTVLYRGELYSLYAVRSGEG
ncbi:MAG: glycosyltransferase family 39 protein [Deltaproteobacteria bacterium]|nr:MAG: glycosyltransferase family 39 protein [Deltaproteobacteria bacterium]